MAFTRPRHILGFSPAAAERQWQWEDAALAGLRPSLFEGNLRSILRWHREPGQQGDREAAAFVAQRLEEIGFQTELVPFLQYLRYPGHVHLQMLQPEQYECRFLDDPPSSYPDPMPGGWIAYAASGSVTAPVIYASFGGLRDYQELRNAGLDPAGKLVMLRFGQPADDHQTTTKVQLELAQQMGAAGVIFYIDPAYDGFCRGPVYPDGPWRNSTSVFRSNGKLGRPGDARSPGWASLPGAPRLAESEAELPGIPAVSLAYGEARRFLEALDGPVAPERMQGGFPFPYRLGGGEPVARLDADMPGADYTLYNVVATVPGDEEGERCVYLGTHHDSWDAGAHDNAGGVAALLSVAESFASALHAGYRPRRTLRLISFDGEEVCYGGSTEYVEEHVEELRQNAVALMYVDGFTSGNTWSESFAPSMVPLLEDVIRGVRDPLLDASVLDAHLQRHGPLNWPPPGTVDTLPFYHMAGLPCSYHILRGENGVTHSPHDTIEYVLQQDPWHRYSIVNMEVWLRGALRLAGAELLPLDYRRYAAGYGERLHQLTSLFPVLGTAAPLLDVIERYARATATVGQFQDDFSTGAISRGGQTLCALNALLVRMERDLCTEHGPAHAPWYHHTYASPAYRATNYELATYPELTAALLAGDQRRVEQALPELELLFSTASATCERFAEQAAEVGR